MLRPAEHKSQPHGLKGLHGHCTLALKQGWWDRPCACYPGNLHLHSVILYFYAEWERIHCESDVELLTGCKCFAHVPRILNMLQAAHCKILHFKCIELKRLWDYLGKLLICCWPLNFTHLPSGWAPQLRLEHIFWKDILTWDELNFQKHGKSPTSSKRTLSDCALLPWHFKHGESQHTKIVFCQDAKKQQISHSQIWYTVNK